MEGSGEGGQPSISETDAASRQVDRRTVLKWIGAGLGAAALAGLGIEAGVLGKTALEKLDELKKLPTEKELVEQWNFNEIPFSLHSDIPVKDMAIPYTFGPDEPTGLLEKYNSNEVFALPLHSVNSHPDGEARRQQALQEHGTAALGLNEMRPADQLGMFDPMIERQSRAVIRVPKGRVFVFNLGNIPAGWSLTAIPGDSDHNLLTAAYGQDVRTEFSNRQNTQLPRVDGHEQFRPLVAVIK